MYAACSVLGVIPARGGSKGVPRKNIRDLAGKPLIAWTIEAARSSRYIDRLIVSSDDEEIIDVSRRWGCDVPFRRPARLAEDTASGTAPLLHALQQLPGYDYAVLLQPTSPLRTTADIDACIDLCIGRGAPSAVSVTVVDKHPAWMYELRDGHMRPILEAQAASRRQDLPPVYSLNGAVYVVAAARLVETGAILEADTLAYEMPKMRSVDIDTEFDFEVAELVLRQMGSSGRADLWESTPGPGDAGHDREQDPIC